MDILTRINWVDILILIIVLRVTYLSFNEGLSHALLPLFGSVAMVVVSLGYYGVIGSLLPDGSIKKLLGGTIDFLTFLALVIVTGIVFKLLKILSDFIIKFEWNSSVERYGGAICGAVRALIAASLILMVLSMAPLPYLQRSIRSESLSGRYVLAIGPYIYGKLVSVIPWVVPAGGTAESNDIIKKLEADKSIDIDGGSIIKNPHKAEWEKAAEL